MFHRSKWRQFLISLSQNISKVSRYSLELLLQLPDMKSNDHQTSSLLLWQDTSMEMDFLAQSAFQKCKRLTSNSTHPLWQTDNVDYHSWCSSLWHWSQSLLHITRWEWSAYHLLFKNFDINWMKLCTRRVLAIEILNDVYSYKVEIHTDCKYVLEKDKLTLPDTSWWP